MKLATFTWSATVQVPDEFTDEFSPSDVSAERLYQSARHAAWQNVQMRDGELTDLQDDYDPNKEK